jgi:hypothetical protein
MAGAATVVRFVSPAQANTPSPWSAMAAVRRCLSSASSTTAAGQGGYRGGSPQQGLRVLHRQRGHRVGCQPLSLQMVALLALLLPLAQSAVAASLEDASSVENLSTGGVGGGGRGGGSRTCEAAGVCDPGSSARWKAAQWHGFYYVLAGLLLWPCSICLVLVLANRSASLSDPPALLSRPHLCALFPVKYDCHGDDEDEDEDEDDVSLILGCAGDKSKLYTHSFCQRKGQPSPLPRRLPPLYLICCTSDIHVGYRMR